MKITWLVGIVSVAVALQFMPRSAQAFGCPNHIAAAQAAIDKATASTMGMESQMSKEGLTMVQAHIAHAKMTLAEAKFHHENKALEGLRHHAHAIMRANAARGHALAAVGLHSALMKK